MKKKIAIITHNYGLDNYGQILQCYALQRFLRDNYAEFDIKVLNPNDFYEHYFSVKPLYAQIKNAERVVRTYFYAYIMRREKYIQKLKEKVAKKGGKKALLTAKLNAQRDFEGFKKAHIAFFDDLQEFLSADCYIVGSDQIWNDLGQLKLENFTNGKHWLDLYFLKFLPTQSKARKISYAASLGKKDLENDFVKWYFKEALAKFDAISVREACNETTLSELGLKSLCVPDPSQILSKKDYEKLIDLGIKEGKIDPTKSGGKVRKNSVFAYILGNQTCINKDEVMEFLAQNVIYTNGNVDFSCAWDYKCDFAPTLQEWLACVKECKLVVTNSFHGCAFAVVMNTPFVALKLGGNDEPMNTRFEQLFEIFGLQDRLVSNLNELKAVLEKPIDWNEVNKKLSKWRSVGVEFLAENLSL